MIRKVLENSNSRGREVTAVDNCFVWDQGVHNPRSEGLDTTRRFTLLWCLCEIAECSKFLDRVTPVGWAPDRATIDGYRAVADSVQKYRDSLDQLSKLLRSE